MDGLDIIVHNENEVSIRDSVHSLDISDFKWNNLMDLLITKSESVYFFGSRLSYETDPRESMDYVADEKLYIEDIDFEKVLVRVKPVNIINRALFSKLWKAYDESGLVFLTNKKYEQDLIGCMTSNKFGTEIFSRMPGIHFLYRGYEPNVLWIRSNMSINFLISAIK